MPVVASWSGWRGAHRVEIWVQVSLLLLKLLLLGMRLPLIVLYSVILVIDDLDLLVAWWDNCGVVPNMVHLLEFSWEPAPILLLLRPYSVTASLRVLMLRSVGWGHQCIALSVAAILKLLLLLQHEGLLLLVLDQRIWVNQVTLGKRPLGWHSGTLKRIHDVLVFLELRFGSSLVVVTLWSVRTRSLTSRLTVAWWRFKVLWSLELFLLQLLQERHIVSCQLWLWCCHWWWAPKMTAFRLGRRSVLCRSLGWPTTCLRRTWTLCQLHKSREIFQALLQYCFLLLILRGTTILARARGWLLCAKESATLSKVCRSSEVIAWNHLHVWGHFLMVRSLHFLRLRKLTLRLWFLRIGRWTSSIRWCSRCRVRRLLFIQHGLLLRLRQWILRRCSDRSSTPLCFAIFHMCRAWLLLD